ncbi:MAG: ABC transporter ATP-binding protein [Bacillota bacterium]
MLHINLTVNTGEVFGYLGPNGAGKTTTIRLIMGFIRPTRGSLKIFDIDAARRAKDILGRVGYLPGEPSLYENLTGAEFLRYFGRLRGGVDWDYVKELAERLRCSLGQRIGSLSHGGKQKIGLIQAFMHKPELIILDEPSNGLDPLMQLELHRTVLEAKLEGRTVFFSSHVLSEVQKVCDRVGIIRSGKLAGVEDVEALKTRALRHLTVRFATSVPLEAFAGLPGVEEAFVEDHSLRCTLNGKPDALIKAAARFEVTEVISREPSLEDVFFSYYKDSTLERGVTGKN